MIFGYGFVNRALKENVRAIAEEELSKSSMRWRRKSTTASRTWLDYQKLSVVLWGVVKSLQKRVEKLEKKKRGRSN